jgi:hypothetical protein
MLCVHNEKGADQPAPLPCQLCCRSIIPEAARSPVTAGSSWAIIRPLPCYGGFPYPAWPFLYSFKKRFSDSGTPIRMMRP